MAAQEGGTVRDRPEEARAQTCEPTDHAFGVTQAPGIYLSRYSQKGRRRKAQSPGKSAQHDNALDSGDRVNAAVA